MSSSPVLEDVFRRLETASQAIEDIFVAIGGRLETAVDILDRLGQTFDSLQLDLASENLLGATRSMGQVATRIATLATGTDGVPEALQEIMNLTVTVEQRLYEMHKAVKSVDVLAVNAKIAAAHISSAGKEFVSFADEINAALKVAAANLGEFSTELSQVISTIRTASKGQAALRQRQTDAAATVPQALSQSVATIGEHRDQAGKSATIIREKTTHVARQVGIAVMALQIGDTTRQRIEHVEYAIDVLQVMQGGRARSQHQQRQQPFHLPSHIDEAGRAAIIGTIGKLQADQLTDTADELDSQLQRILAVLTTLTRDAREIAGLGQRAYGASGLEGGTFLDDLRDKVGQANDLLDGLTAAQHDADNVVQSVLTAATSLSGHMKSIQSLESDIRLMGLNTTLKSSRLGTEGRSLTVIAQELRGCSNITAAEAETIMHLLEDVTATATRLTARETAKQSDETNAIADIMRNSVEQMNGVASSLTAALATLSRDSETVVALLDETLLQVTAHQAIGGTLRQSAAALAEIAALPVVGSSDVDEILEDMQAALFKSYTMSRERDIHARIFQASAATIDTATMPPPSAATAEAELDDMLF
jgi:methyl-accepting chemotaxis protein